jgi:hypothetical protein
MVLNIIVGLSLITFGILFIRFNYKNPNDTFRFLDLGGYMGGILSVILGIMCITGNGGNLMEGIREALEELKAKFK